MSRQAVEWPKNSHVFIDESKERDYTLVAATIASNDLTQLRRSVQDLRHSGARCIHMSKEGAASRKRIAGGMSRLPLTTHVVTCARPLSELDRRLACLAHVLDQCELAQCFSLVIELDESIQSHEKQFFVQECRNRQLHPDFAYTWRRRNDEPLLWVSDVVAWGYTKGGGWRQRVSPLISSKVNV